MATAKQHDIDHARVERAWQSWLVRGRPGVGASPDPGRKKALSRRTLGLRLQSHLSVHHHQPDVFGPRSPYGRFPNVTFQDVYDAHRKDHAENPPAAPQTSSEQTI